jgi:phosphoglycolate phosphatase
LPRTILFDLDGTLVDTAPDLTAAMNHALAALGFAAVPAATVRGMVGHGARRLIDQGLRHHGVADAAARAGLVEQGFPLFIHHYRGHIADASRPFDGVERALDTLAAAGCRLGVCTNKPQGLSEQLLAALGWQGRFQAVVGFDAVPVPKPDAGHVHATLAALGGDAADAVFVGDSITDVHAARNAGLPVVAVSFGFADRPAAELGADLLIDHYDALLPALERLAA